MIDDATRRQLQANWQSVRDDVVAAAQRCGRDPEQIQIVGVTKYLDPATAAELARAGCRHLGESRPQLLWEKAEAMADQTDLRWHLIGHLQRNKIRRSLRHRPIIHSVDSARLLQAIAEESVAQQQVTEVLLEVNISGEEAKTGMSADQLTELLDQPPPAGIQIIGLMAMAGWGISGDEARQQFAATRKLRDRLSAKSGLPLRQLSMGMSGDFAEAIAEGATMVRIGSRLFSGLR